ncbi:Ribosomal protein L29e [Spironucleus salmonicida]|uniref:60S ribosomal protein L29 n=1 Tax=Spironucleus salmonicida TaxID=348837 RepID=V6LWG3_9EUKA|nr:Ribosomal protein L29e [Spironucleus salmonicida]|eukprot:EST48588.1 Ribosomal protein L29e [Spironucleus salmonicida]
MSKSKVHTSRGNCKKNHKNGIKKCRLPENARRPGMNQKYIRNVHHARVGTLAKE